MPLSSVLGAQSLVRPGVCTSSTRPASPFEGQLIFETDTNRVVAYDGSAWVYVVDTDQPPALQLIKTQTIGTAVTSVDVTNAFSSDFDNYRVIISGGASSATDGLRMQLGATTSGYYWATSGRTYAGAAVTNQGANVASWYVGDVTATSSHIVFDLSSPNRADETSFTSHSLSVRTDGYYLDFGGYLNNTTSYTAFTVFPATGGTTLTGGTIRVYGYRNS